MLVAVPSYSAAKDWATVAEPPKTEEFSRKLDEFRKAKIGAFMLVSRVDGIDLPHDTCRVMVLDGLPSGSALLERYQWEFLSMQNMFATRLANRIVQLFGRINRGRNDFGAYLVNGRLLNTWLNKDRFVALLPDLLQKQILLGRYVQETMEITTNDKVVQMVSAVLAREAGWIDFYGRYLAENALDEDATERAADAEKRMTQAAIAEAEYARATWEGDFSAARLALEGTIEETARADTLLAGWHSVWLAACYEVEGDEESARVNYRRARTRLGVRIVVPFSAAPARAEAAQPLGPFAAAVDRIVGLTSEDSFRRELGLLRGRLSDLDGAKPKQMEEAVRALGEALGFEATRPDNDVGTGPDVLWSEINSAHCLAFELKTDKNSPAIYNKKDIGQGHDSLQWVQVEKNTYSCFGLIFVGPDGRCSDEANPAPSMSFLNPIRLAELREEVIALLSDLRAILPIQRPSKTRELCGQEKWTLKALSDRFTRP